MSTAEVNRRRGGAFTLLEIMLAVAILGMMSLAIYRFVQTNITALRISAETSAADAQYSGLLNLLTAEWQNLPSGAGALTGEPFKQNGQQRDEITWTAAAGPGLLTRYAAGEYTVSMSLRRVSAGSDKLEIGFARKPKSAPPRDRSKESWVPLLRNVQTLQIRYFDSRLNTWVERWTDTITLPRLIKVTIGRTDEAVPWEAIVALGRTPL